jgi:hypothetical protein
MGYVLFTTFAQLPGMEVLGNVIGPLNYCGVGLGVIKANNPD